MLQLQIISVGKLKDDAERTLAVRYSQRIAGLGRALGFSDLAVREIPESRARTAAQRKAEEADEILSAARGTDVFVLLDETGRSLSSRAFSTQLGTWRDDGIQSLVFVIGGPDGAGDALKKRARQILAFGQMTLPHGLARAVLMEQIYRAMTILSGHPYHRD